jgi:hypothetical protein
VKLKPNGLRFRWSAPRRGRAPDEVIENFVVIEKVTSFAYGQFVGRIGHRHLLAVIPGAPLVEVAIGDGSHAAAGSGIRVAIVQRLGQSVEGVQR